MLQVAKERVSSGLFTAADSAFNLAAESTHPWVHNSGKIGIVHDHLNHLGIPQNILTGH